MSSIAFGWLALAILSAGLRWRRRAWPALFAGLLAWSFAAQAGLISSVALPVSLLLLLLTQLKPATAAGEAAALSEPLTRTRRLCGLLYWPVLAVLSLALALHLVPGSHNPLLLDNIQLSSDSLPYTLYANFDKGWAGYCLLLALSGSTQQRQLSCWQLLAGAGMALGLTLGLALTLGLIRFDPKWPAFLPQFIFCNLLLTCVAEEAFFRGLLQQKLTRRCEQRGYHWYWALVSAALLFGLAHAGGGWAYVLVATLAGAGYGWLYRQTGQLWPAILLHFALNLTHLLLFSYPMLQPAFPAN